MGIATGVNDVSEHYIYAKKGEIGALAMKALDFIGDVEFGGRTRLIRLDAAMAINKLGVCAHPTTHRPLFDLTA
eukprot:SAG31_NODE_3079_length_4706_cov_3.887779_7_plen_74_part_00